MDHNVRDSRSEVPIWFRADHQDLFGILTVPRGVSRGIGVVLVNAGYHTAVDRNRLTVILARRLAALGFHVLRFDYHGAGESGGKDVGTFDLDQPFTADLMSAVEELRRRGLDQFILVGRCFGARTALSTITRVPGLRGLALISMPYHNSGWWTERLERAWPPGLRSRISAGLAERPHLRWFLRAVYYGIRRRLPRPWSFHRNAGADWISLPVARWLRRAMEGRVPLLFLHATDDYDYEEFRHVLDGPLGALIAQAGDRVQASTLPGTVRSHEPLNIQQAIITHVQEWIDSVASNQTADKRSGRGAARV